MIENVNSNGSSHVSAGDGSNASEIQQIDNQIKRLQEQLKSLKSRPKNSQADQTAAEKKIKNLQEQIQRLQERKMQARQKQSDGQKAQAADVGSASRQQKGNGGQKGEPFASPQMLDMLA